jgi:hypothetical protein
MKESAFQPPGKKPIGSSVRPNELLALSGKKALDLILESPTPALLVQSLAEEDLFWLVRDIGPEDALPVLSLASNDQWQYLLDLELWKKDRLQMNAVNRWLRLLLKADPERFLIWTLREHIELIELNLSKNIEVRIRQEDESASDFDEGYFTLDGVFYIRISREEHYEGMREFLERFQRHNPEKFHRVLLELTGVMPAEVEEMAYRLRNIRLAEKGFLPFEEAVGIYQYLSPESLTETEPGAQRVVQGPVPAVPVPVSASLLIKDRDLFVMSLKHINEGHTMERLQTEFAAMCNQVISADGLMLWDKESLAGVVRKACGYLSIGLEKTTDGHQITASRLLQRVALGPVFRVGYGAALELQWKAKKWLRQSWFVKEAFGLSFWEEAWEGLLEGLLKKRPLFCTSYTGSSEGEPYREFKTLEEITYCHKALDEIMALDQLLSALAVKTSVVRQVQTYQPVTYKNLLLTCWARYLLGLSEDWAPLPFEYLKPFFENLWTKSVGPYRVEEEIKQSFFRWLAATSGAAIPEVLGQPGTTLRNLFEELEKEYGSVSLEELDPRYVRHLSVES